MENRLSECVKKGCEDLYSAKVATVDLQATRKEFEGDVTVVVFALMKWLRGNPQEIGNALGEYLVKHLVEVVSFNVVKGFLNITLSNDHYLATFNQMLSEPEYGIKSVKSGTKGVMVEYSSPNTNKPLHLGHIRNNLLGYSVAEIIKATGKEVYKTQIINDRGIHICKSMLAWQRYGNGDTPERSGVKGDKLVGNYYVTYDKVYKEEVSQLIAGGIPEDEAKKKAPILLEAQEMLRKWEAGDPEIVTLWQRMNQWVYDGFEVTYKELGVDFDKNYYESETYLLGKNVVLEGLERGVFYRKEDGSVWIDLSDEGLDEKIVLRADGTAVYMTQDIGTAIERFKDYDLEELVYTVGNEQDYHFKVLILILKKLGFDWAEQLYHLSYGMVDLPSGKMKSREGTVVDADDLLVEMTNTARSIASELGKLEGYTEEEREALYKIIGKGALKYFILKVDPRKRILFDPEESVDFTGNTGPFIQYAYARIQSILRKAEFKGPEIVEIVNLENKERNLIKHLQAFPQIIQQAAENHSPALVANYTYDLVKEYNSFYQSVPILGISDLPVRHFRVQLSYMVGEVIKKAFGLLGIEVPPRM